MAPEPEPSEKKISALQLERFTLRAMNTAGTKVCTKCNQTLSVDEFYRKASAKDGRRSWCIPCFKADGAERMKRRRVNGRWVYSLRNGRQRARDKGLPSDNFTEEEMIAYWESQSIDPESSIYSGEPLGDDHHLDHVIPLSDPASPGHVISNVVPALSGENILKANYPLPVGVALINDRRGVKAPFDAKFATAVWSHSGDAR